jgi:hypothetical protein
MRDLFVNLAGFLFIGPLVWGMESVAATRRTWDRGPHSSPHVSRNIDAVPNRTSRPTYLLRESHREGNKVRKRTLANLSALSDERIAAIRAVLAGANLRRSSSHRLTAGGFVGGHSPNRATPLSAQLPRGSAAAVDSFMVLLFNLRPNPSKRSQAARRRPFRRRYTW